MNTHNEQLQHKTFFSKARERVMYIIRSFTPAELALFGGLLAILIISGLFMLSRANQLFLVEVPEHGGHFSEGIIGSPRFINPLLAISDADRDLTALVYSGLMRRTPEGDLIPDLAKQYSISEDGLTYIFMLRDDIFFHDDTAVTADDIVFTIEKAQDPALKSPKRASWDGITVIKVSEKEIHFILKQPYAPFLENTTLGILPHHIWKEADIEQFPFSLFNIEPIGSGPYVVKKIKRNVSGVPTFYELTGNPRYALGKPYISNITIMFYANETALLEGFKKREVENINSITSETVNALANDTVRIERSPLPRIFAIFFNQNQAPLFTHKEVRQALDVALDKKRIVKEVLGGYGTDITSPIPPGILPKKESSVDEAPADEDGTAVPEPEKILEGKERARDILEQNGWKWDEEEAVWKKRVKGADEHLRFSLMTSNSPELKQAAELIAKEWQDIGVVVDLKIFETSDLNQNVIRPRKYDALFFGEIVGRELDLFAFWHSSQRNDPGLNIALYANIAADKLLEEARTLSDKKERALKYRAFEEEIENDVPAVFIYSPDFIYIVAEKISGLRLGSITTPSERFLNVHEWYIETDNVWGVFK